MSKVNTWQPMMSPTLGGRSVASELFKTISSHTNRKKLKLKYGLSLLGSSQIVQSPNIIIIKHDGPGAGARM